MPREMEMAKSVATRIFLRDEFYRFSEVKSRGKRTGTLVAETKGKVKSTSY
jgi:hypothetical protein